MCSFVKCGHNKSNEAKISISVSSAAYGEGEYTKTELRFIKKDLHITKDTSAADRGICNIILLQVHHHYCSKHACLLCRAEP